MDENGSIKWQGIFKHHIWTLSQSNNQLHYNVLNPSSIEDTKLSSKRRKKLSSDNNEHTDTSSYESLLSDYLRLNENLEELYSDWSSRDPNFKNSAEKFFGIRMLKQDPVENIFSFICSTNNNIFRYEILHFKFKSLFRLHHLCDLHSMHAIQVNISMNNTIVSHLTQH